MSEAKRNREIEPKAAMMTPETLKQTLGELALNIDSLVDNLTMEMPARQALPPESAGEHPFEALPPDLRGVVVVEQQDAPATPLARLAAAAPPATFESGAKTNAVGAAGARPTPTDAVAQSDQPVKASSFSIAEDAELVDIAEGLIDSVQANARDASGITRSKQSRPAKATRQRKQKKARAAQPTDSRVPKSHRKADVALDRRGVVKREVDEPAVAGAVDAEVQAEIEVSRDATTASVIPWAASESSAPSKSAGLLWKLAAALAAVGLLGGGWFVLSGGRASDASARTATDASARTATDPSAGRAPRAAAPRVVLQSSDSTRAAASGLTTASMVEAPGSGERAPTTAIDSTPIPAPSEAAARNVATAGGSDAASAPTRATIGKRQGRADVATPVPAWNAMPRTAESKASAAPVAVGAKAVVLPSAEKPTPSVTAPAGVPPTATQAAISSESTANQPLPTPTETMKQAAPTPAVAAVDLTAPRGVSGPAPAVISPPKLIRRGVADYTQRARNRGERGVVELRLLVATTGRVKRVVVEHGIPGSEIEAIAITAALQSSYEPALRGGEAVEGWASERFVFEP